jgi:protein-glutamine gamma-glutamyltransferase
MNPGVMPAASAMPATTAPRVVNRFFEVSLLGMLASGFLAVASSGALDWPTAVLALAALIVRGLMVAEWVTWTIPSRVVGALAVGYLAFFGLDIYYISGSFLAATVHMVFFLAVLKLLTAKTARDYGYLKVIAGLELISAAILSNGLTFLICLAIFLLFAIATFAAGEVRRSSGARIVISRDGLKAFSRRLGWLTACLFTGILVMTAGLFFLLPRTARAAFSRFAPRQERLTGFSNSVTLGEIGQIKQSTIPVMHVRSYQGEGFLPVKWRGATLAEFDGHRWFNRGTDEGLVRNDSGIVAVRTAVQGNRQGRNLVYQVHLEPMVSDTLFFAGNPETIRIDVPFLRYTRSGTFHVSPRFGYRGLNYSVYGFLPDEWAEVRFTSAPLAESIRRELLSLPPLDPRIPQLARDMTAGADNEVQKARAMESHLRRDYGYTLELLKTPVADPLSYFLFERRKGHCEYFASAMAVMLRTIGIPARVVTGFQSGVYNSITGWQVVRAADAHSWVEAWLEGRGWTTFDPTPADPSASSGGLLSQLSLLSDTMQQFWQDWVMSYDFDRQVALASRMQTVTRQFRLPRLDEIAAGFKNAATRALPWIPWISALAALIVITIVFGPSIRKWWDRRSRLQRVQRGEGHQSDATILYQQLLALLERRGIRKPPWLTPNEFAGVIRAPELSVLVSDATSAYNDLRFGGRGDAALVLMHAIQQIERL